MTKREIKFRVFGWDLDKLEWVLNPEGYNKIFSNGTFALSETIGHQEIGERYIEQYTGLKDANGVEVYENDLLETDWIIDSEGYFITELGQVVWRGNGWKVLVDGNKYDLISAWEENGFAVIGNVHQNPELLGE